MEIRIADCPLGAKCEEVKDENGKQVLYRCPWFVKLRGKDPQGEQEFNEWRCAIAWQPILAIENVQQTRQVGAAIESLRNEMVKGQNNLMLLAVSKQKQIEGH